MELGKETEPEKFRSGDLIAVFQFHEAVFHQFMPEENRMHILLHRQQHRCNSAWLSEINIITIACTNQKTLRPAMNESGRPATENFPEFLLVAILAGRIAGIVYGIDTVIIIPCGAGGPTRVECIKRTHDGGGFSLAVIKVCLRVADICPSVERLWVGNFKFRALPVHVRQSRKSDAQPGAEQVVFLDAEAGFIVAPGARHTAGHVDRPGVARGDLDIDHSIRVCRRLDFHVVEMTNIAQQSFTLLDFLR